MWRQRSPCTSGWPATLLMNSFKRNPLILSQPKLCFIIRWKACWEYTRKYGMNTQWSANKHEPSKCHKIVTKLFFFPNIWNYLKARPAFLNELLLKNTWSTIALEQLLKFSPSSFLRKGSCLVSALPGRFGTLIWTVRVTWTDWRWGESVGVSNDFESCLMLSPHLSTIWTQSSASAQRLLATVEKKIENLSFGRFQTFLCLPWKPACWSSWSSGSQWTWSDPLHESLRRPHLSPGSSLRFF